MDGFGLWVNVSHLAIISCIQIGFELCIGSELSASITDYLLYIFLHRASFLLTAAALTQPLRQLLREYATQVAGIYFLLQSSFGLRMCLWLFSGLWWFIQQLGQPIPKHYYLAVYSIVCSTQQTLIWLYSGREYRIRSISRHFRLVAASNYCSTFRCAERSGRVVEPRNRDSIANRQKQAKTSKKTSREFKLRLVVFQNNSFSFKSSSSSSDFLSSSLAEENE